MALYTQTFHFRQPFQVLVSDDILLLPAAQQLDIVKLFGTCVQAEIKPMMTQCCMESLYALGPSAQNTTNLSKTFERRRCNHRTALPPLDCLLDVIGPTNKHRYVLAAQSVPLLEKMDRIPGVPVLHFNGRGVLVLSPPSAATIREKNKSEEERRMGERKGMEGIVEGGNVIGGGSVGVVGEKRGGRGKGGNPNPLSMKKKKTAGADGKEGKREENEGKKRRIMEEEDERGDEDEEDEVDLRENQLEGDAVEAGGEGRKKKKRKRRGKGEVALAIQELNQTGGIGVNQETGSNNGESD